MIKIIINAWQNTIKQWRILIWVYLIQFILVAFLALQFRDVFESSISYSLDFKKLILHYDHTVILDFLNTSGHSISLILNQLKYLIIIWLFITVFIDGGLLFVATQSNKISLINAWNHGTTYYLTFLKMGSIFLVLSTIWTALLFIPLATNLESCIRYFSSEKYTLWLIAAIIILWIKGLVLLFAWSVSSRLSKIHHDLTIFQSLKLGLQHIFKNKFRFLVILILYILIHIKLLCLYLYLEASSGMTSPIYIFTFFIIQQCFVFFRIILRQWIYTGIAILHSIK